MHDTVTPMNGAAVTAIVIVNYGSHAMIEAGLTGLVLPAEEFRVVLVDNPTTRDERAAALRLCADHRWELVTPARNAGFGAGVNAGLRRALALGAESFVLLNPDVQVGSAVLAALRRHVQADHNTAVSPVLRTATGGVEFRGSTLDLADGCIRGVARKPGRGSPQRPQPWLPGTCLAFHRDLLARSGPFDERYFLYWEDVDLSYRYARAGAQLVVRPDLEVVHIGGGTQGQRRGVAKSNRYYRYNCRNRLLFAARHLDRRSIVRWMIHTPRVSWQILLQGGRRQLLYSPRPALSAIAGTLTGLMIATWALTRSHPPAAPRAGWWNATPQADS